jgi:hypothetical protein
MKKHLIFLFVVVLNSLLLSQVELKGTMGINFLSTPSLQDYINQSYAPSNEQLGSFSSAVIFTGEVGKFLSKEIELSIEIPYQIYSYSQNTESGNQYELNYNLLLPSAMVYYVISGEGYNFKFGAGAGPRFSSVTEDQGLGLERELSSTGIGGLIRVEGNTLLSENLFANIGFDLRYDINGEPEDEDGGKLTYNYQGVKNVNLDTFSVGVKLGISYLIGGTD